MAPAVGTSPNNLPHSSSGRAHGGERAAAAAGRRRWKRTPRRTPPVSIPACKGGGAVCVARARVRARQLVCAHPMGGRAGRACTCAHVCGLGRGDAPSRCSTREETRRSRDPGRGADRGRAAFSVPAASLRAARVPAPGPAPILALRVGARRGGPRMRPGQNRIFLSAAFHWQSAPPQGHPSPDSALLGRRRAAESGRTGGLAR